MSDTHNLSPLPSAVHIGQNTSIEWARAASEVQALVSVAQNRPRIKAVCIQQMEEVCKQESFAATAFYDYKRGTKRIYDINVGTAKTLALLWTNIQFGITELSQDRARHESEMLAWAWDMQSNFRVERRVVIPHVRDSNEKGAQILTEVRDVYELLANHASRRLRECIKDVLPGWFITDAKKAMWRTLEHGGGEPLPKRIAGVVRVFATEYGVRLSQLEAKVEAKSNDWTEMDVARLRVSYEQLGQGVRVEDEFPPVRVESSDLVNTGLITPPSLATPAAPVPAPEQPPAEQKPVQDNTTPAHDAPTPDEQPMATKGHIQTIHARLNKLDYPTGTEGTVQKMADLTVIAGRPITSTADLTAHEANDIITALNTVLADEHPGHALDNLLTERREGNK